MDREQLEAWLSEGLSLEQIGRLVDRHPSTVAYWVEKHGLRAAHRERHVPRGEIAREDLEALLARGLSTRDIAAALGRSQTNVRYWMTRHGLRPGVRPARVTPISERRGRGTCRVHGPVEFVRRPDGAWRCTRCRIELVNARRRRVKQTLVTDAGGACVLCGYDSCLAALQFHHLDPSAKGFAVAAAGVARSLAAARAEAAKCVLLCANCHAEVESGLAAIPANICSRAADHPR